jgi:phospholipid/cholesterol/gamma-HCH transport system substrate-binding protein
MRVTDSAKVGLTALAAAAVLMAGTFSLRGVTDKQGSYLKTVSFKDAQGIQEGAFVRVRGVEIGSVEETRLGSRGDAELVLRISKDYDIRPDDAIRISGGVFGFGQAYVEITPQGRKVAQEPRADGVLIGDSGPSTETVLSRSEELLANLNGLVSNMDRLTAGLAKAAEDPRLRTSLAQTLKNFETISGSGVVIARNMETTTAGAGRLMVSFKDTSSQLAATLKRAETLLGTFQGTATQSEGLMREMRAMTADTRAVVKDSGELVRTSTDTVKKAGDFVQDTRGILTDNREALKDVFQTLSSALKKLDGTLAEAQAFLGDPKIRQDLQATAANVRDATDNLKKITADFQGVTGDPKVQEDLKTTLANLRDVTAEAGQVFKRINSTVGGGGKGLKSIGERLSATEFRSEVVRRVETGRTRMDLDATIPWSGNSFYRLGLYDFGEASKFNIQAGMTVHPNVAARFGIHASKLGLGLDVGNRRRPPLTVDVFGLDRPQVDIRGAIPIWKSIDLTVGVDNLGRRTDPVVGLRYQK